MTDNEIEHSVLFYLRQHVGRNNPIGRWDLVEKVFGASAVQDRGNNNPSDRSIRDAIERMRKRGEVICDMGDGSGRFLAETLDEYQLFRAKYGSVAFQILETLREMDKAASQKWNSNPSQERLM